MKRDHFDKNDWLRDFESFLNAPPIDPPTEVSRQLFSLVKHALNPPLSTVFMKTVAVQGATAFVLLLFCPQLGVGPLLGQDFIMDLFMHFGPLYCSAFCGAFFLGTATLVACLSLKREELKVIYRYRLISISLITALTLSGLMLAGGEADEWSYVFWAVGALLGAFLSLGSVTKIRSGLQPNLRIS